jgi:hypothetical protein
MQQHIVSTVNQGPADGGYQSVNQQSPPAKVRAVAQQGQSLNQDEEVPEVIEQESNGCAEDKAELSERRNNVKQDI